MAPAAEIPATDSSGLFLDLLSPQIETSKTDIKPGEDLLVFE
jgi:hypothetical protein